MIGHVILVLATESLCPGIVLATAHFEVTVNLQLHC